MIVHLFLFHKVVYVVRVCAEPWYSYKMVTQNMLRTHERKNRFVTVHDNLIRTGQITKIATYLRTYF